MYAELFENIQTDEITRCSQVREAAGVVSKQLTLLTIISPRLENLWGSRILEVPQLADKHRVPRCETPVAPGIIACRKY